MYNIMLPRHMRTTASATVFRVSDVAKSVRFYTDLLGFVERFQFGDYAGVQHGEVQIHLAGPTVPNPKKIGESASTFSVKVLYHA